MRELAADRARELLIASWAVWALCFLVVVYWWIDPFDLASVCDFGTASSFFGEPEHSWFPPGTSCTWKFRGVEHTDSPSLLRLLFVAACLLGPALSLYLRHLLRGLLSDAR